MSATRVLLLSGLALAVGGWLIGANAAMMA